MKIFPVLVIGALAATGCARDPKQKSYEDESKSTTIVRAGGGGGTQSASLISIPLGVEYSQFSLLGVPATAWTVDLTSCLSGYTATVTEANLDGVEVYKDDRNCLAKLKSFTVGGVTYNTTNAGAADFTTWLANDTATFAGPAGQIMKVKVTSQLQSPIAGTEAIVYNFSEIDDATGDKVFLEADVSDAHSITVEGQEPPSFTIVGWNYIGMNDTTGAGQFTFKMECVDDPTAGTPTSVAMTDGTATNSVCGSTDLQDVSYKLVKDTYTSVMTITDADTVFATAGTSVTMPGDQYSDSATNEGFNTSTLDGPGGLGVAGNENMILIIKAGTSYTYFNVDVTTITQ